MEGTGRTYVSTFHVDLKSVRPRRAEDRGKDAPAPDERRCLRDSSTASSSGGRANDSTPTSLPAGVARLDLSEGSTGDAGIYTGTAASPAWKQPSGAGLRAAGSQGGSTRSTGRSNEEETLQTEEREVAHRAAETAEEEKDISPRRDDSKEPPVVFLDPPEQLEVRVGKPASLHCAFRICSSPVACCWIHNGDKVVLSGPRTSVRTTERGSTVVVSQARPEDAGSYTAVVRTRRGLGHRTVSLSVIDRPLPPASQPVVSQLSSGSLVLSWTGPSYDGGTAILGYRVEVRREDQPEPLTWTGLSVCCKNTSYRVRSGLEAQGRYRFRVLACNAAGVSDPSEESECVKMEAKGAPQEEAHAYVTVTVDTVHQVEDHYDMHEKLGGGKFGQVFRLSHKETGDVCAGKFYRVRGSKDRAAARREMELMNGLHHPKLVQCLAAYDSRAQTVMVMEYIAGGELFERIVDDSFEHTEPTSSRYMQQILEGMQFVHRLGIVHLDLKPENIVCVNDTGTQIKLIDFGLARKLEPGKPLMVMHGTPEFVAPEVVNFEPVGLETDMWSIGVICFILLSGESPFQGNSDAETLALVTAAKYDFDPESFEDISAQAKEFISSLLKKDRRCRLSCDEGLAHPWMASFSVLNRRPTKSLKKEKMKRFLAKRKWKKTGKAVLALQRMSNLSNRPDSPRTSTDEPAWSPEAEQAIQGLEKQLWCEPRFLRTLRDTTLPEGATAQLTCTVHGFPEPEVEWLLNEEPLAPSSRTSMERGPEGLCSLVVSDLRPSDDGVYRCRATNHLGEALCSAKLAVRG